jgi:hypothetical protein
MPPTEAALFFPDAHSAFALEHVNELVLAGQQCADQFCPLIADLAFFGRIAFRFPDLFSLE